MKAFEVAKKEARSVMTHGRIMMAVEGQEAKVKVIVGLLKDRFSYTNCADEGDKEGEIAVYFIVDRLDKESFMQAYKQAKKGE